MTDNENGIISQRRCPPIVRRRMLLMPTQPMIAIRPGFQPTSAGIRGSRGRGTIIGNAGLNRLPRA
jgi:hypothetical protein